MILITPTAINRTTLAMDAEKVQADDWIGVDFFFSSGIISTNNNQSYLDISDFSHLTVDFIYLS